MNVRTIAPIRRVVCPCKGATSITGSERALRWMLLTNRGRSLECGTCGRRLTLDGSAPVRWDYAALFIVRPRAAND